MEMRKILAKRLEYLGIQHLENPEVSNKSQRFNEEVGNIGGFLEMIVIIIWNVPPIIINFFRFNIREKFTSNPKVKSNKIIPK